MVKSCVLVSAWGGPTPYQLVEVKDRSAGIPDRRTIEWLAYVDRLIREPAYRDRNDRQNEIIFGIQRHNHLIGRDGYRIAGFDAALDLEEMQVPGDGVAALDIVTDLCG